MAWRAYRWLGRPTRRSEQRTWTEGLAQGACQGALGVLMLFLELEANGWADGVLRLSAAFLRR